jgi:hypothetical protein
MRKLPLLAALILIAGAYGCARSPVQPSARDARPVTDDAPSDTTRRGGNVMGSGH